MENLPTTTHTITEIEYEFCITARIPYNQIIIAIVVYVSTNGLPDLSTRTTHYLGSDRSVNPLFARTCTTKSNMSDWISEIDESKGM